METRVFDDLRDLGFDLFQVTLKQLQFGDQLAVVLQKIPMERNECEDPPSCSA